MKPLGIIFVTLAVLGRVVAAEDLPPTDAKPEIEGRPVFLTFGRVVVHPKGVDEPPESYKGALHGTRPLAVIKIGDKILGEVYGNTLQGKAKDEAEGMAGSAGKSPQITLLKRDSAERSKQRHEFVTLRMDVDSKVGKPWIIHSLYFTNGDHSVTFKLVAGAQNFERALPFFEAMFFTEEFMRTPSNKTEEKSTGQKEPGVEQVKEAAPLKVQPPTLQSKSGTR